jgi:hypothetical protein
MSRFKQLVQLSSQLLPRGRAFRMFSDSSWESLFRALSRSEAEAYEVATSTFNSMFPDNDQFTADDATDWERRLGMTSNPLNPLATRKLAIRRKMAAPGQNPARGHYLFIQKQLQDAGFPVYVYENIFPAYPSGYTTVQPGDLNPAVLEVVDYDDIQYGDSDYDAYCNHVIAKSLINDDDIRFDVGVDLSATFFIGGSPLGTMASIPAIRETEFRQLVLQLKQLQNVAFLFIQYT